MALMEKLLDLIQPGTTVFVPGSSGEPTAALQALANAPERCDGVHFITTFVPGINTFDLASLGTGANFTSFFMHPSLAAAQTEGRLRLIDLPWSRLPEWLSLQKIDIALAQVSAECRNGQHSLGPAVEFTPMVLAQASEKVAITNACTPWMDGSVALETSLFDLVIEGTHALPGYPDPIINDLYQKIGTQVAQLIPNSATIQVGLGQAPAAALDALHNHRDIRLHSGIFFDCLLRLIDSGVMATDRPLVSGLAVGSRKFYGKLKNYPGIRMIEVGQTHNPETIRKIDNFFTINSAIEVDLEGNVNAQVLGGKHISGQGGLPDFTTAGHESRGGASIIVLPSTNSKGNKSRIVRKVQHLTVPGANIDYVITEHGCAKLKGNNAAERICQLRNVSAPQFADVLSESEQYL